MGKFPDELEIVGGFVNTREVEEGTDDIATPEGLRGWLVERGLLAPGEEVGADDVVSATGLREAIRTLALHNNGEPVDVGSSTEVLNETALAAGFTLRFGAQAAEMVPSGTGVAAALGRIVAPIAEAMAAGSWDRFKTCASDECLWAFYDRARNHSRRWCSMEVCGNRVKARSFRARRSQSP